MSLKKLCKTKAISIFIVGMAFLFFGCRPGGLVRERVKVRKAASVLHQTAEEYLKADQHLMALTLFTQVSTEYPDYAEMPVVHYKIAKCLYLAGEYHLSNERALKWLNTYPNHPQKKEVMMLLGDNYEALENRPQAFYWFLEAEKESFHEPMIRAELDERLEYLIMTSSIEDLDRMMIYAAGTHYAPMARQRRALVFLEQDDLEKAREVALSIVRDTQNQDELSAGMALLERIQEEMSVKKGVIGCLLPLTGPFAIYGEEVLNGIQLGVFNGHSAGSKIELIIKDTADDPNLALTGLEDLAHNENVMAVIGPLASRTAGPVAKRAQELGVPVITLTQKAGVTDEGDMVFRNFLTPSREVNRVLSQAVLEKGIERFAILYPDNAYGRFFMTLFWDRLEELGGTVTALESYPPQTTDFGDQIKKMTGVHYPMPESLTKKMRDLRPPEEAEYTIYSDDPEPFIDFDAVFIPDNPQRIAMIAPQLPYHDVQDVQLMGTTLWQSRKLIALAKDYIQGAIFPSSFFEGSEDPVVKKFVAAYKNNYGTSPGMLAAEGYDTVRLLAWIMDLEEVKTRKGVRNTLYMIQTFAGVTGNIAFNEQGELQNEPFLLTISGRKMVMLP